MLDADDGQARGPAQLVDQGCAGPWPCRRGSRLIRQHGDEAPIHAAMRADAMLDKGDLDGRAVWLRIVKAVEELLSKDRPADAKLH